MAATVGGQVTNRRFRFPQSAKECVKVPGEIPGMENRTVFRAEQIFPGMGQMLEPVSQLRQKRNGAQTALCFGFMLRYTGPVMDQVHGTVDGQRLVRDIGFFQAQQLPTANARSTAGP